MLVPTATVGHASCSMTYPPSALGSGPHTLTAVYAGDTTHATSHGTLALAVTTAGRGGGAAGGARGSSGPTLKQIKASLLAQLTPHGKAAKIKAHRAAQA
jgi:hypothetical protein